MVETIGMIKWFAGQTVPRDYAKCDGQILSIDEQTALFAVILNTFGGSLEEKKFALPKLEAPVGMYIICIKGLFPDWD